MILTIPQAIQKLSPDQGPYCSHRSRMATTCGMGHGRQSMIHRPVSRVCTQITPTHLLSAVKQVISWFRKLSLIQILPTRRTSRPLHQPLPQSRADPRKRTFWTRHQAVSSLLERLSLTISAALLGITVMRKTGIQQGSQPLMETILDL